MENKQKGFSLPPDSDWYSIYFKKPKNGEKCKVKRKGEESFVSKCIYNNGDFETYADYSNRLVITKWKADLWLPITN